MDYEGFLELVKTRRSIRSFKPDSVPDSYVDQIIEAARWAPSGANSQPWEFLVIKNRELKEKILQFIKEHGELSRKMELTREKGMPWPAVLRQSDRPGFAEAPVWIILLGDNRTKKAYPLTAYVNRGEAIFQSSLANTFLYMHLAVTSLGLASQWVTSTASHYVQCLIKDLLKIPENLEIYDMMAVGYPVRQPRPRMVRGKSSMMHYDGYDSKKARTDDDVHSFILSLRQESAARP